MDASPFTREISCEGAAIQTRTDYAHHSSLSGLLLINNCIRKEVFHRFFTSLYLIRVETFYPIQTAPHMPEQDEANGHHLSLCGKGRCT